MKWLRIIAVALFLAAPMTVRACPLCSEMIANADSDGDPGDIDQFPTAMNQSIYLMLAVPYTAFGLVGFLIYRGIKQNESYRKGLGDTPPDAVV